MIKKTGCQRDELGTLDRGESMTQHFPESIPSTGGPLGNELFPSLAVSGLCSTGWKGGVRHVAPGRPIQTHFSPLSPLFRHPTQAPVFVSLGDGFLRKKRSECSDGRAGGHFTRGWGPIPARKEGPRKEACRRDQIWCAWVSDRLRFLIIVSSFLEKVWRHASLVPSSA